MAYRCTSTGPTVRMAGLQVQATSRPDLVAAVVLHREGRSLHARVEESEEAKEYMACRRHSPLDWEYVYIPIRERPSSTFWYLHAAGS